MQCKFTAKCGSTTIVGDIFLPERLPAPAVVFSHGFGGTRKSFYPDCRLLAEKGAAAVCFDFRGGSPRSDSGHDTENMTVFTEKEDLFAVIDALARDPRIKADALFLFGESQGGLVSALAAAERPAAVRGLILLYPAFCIPDDWRRVFPTQADIPESHSFWGVTLGRQYFQSIRGLDPFDEIGKYRNPVLIMHGDADDVVPLSYSERAAHAYKNAALSVYPGEGHGFSPAARGRACEETIAFILEKRGC